MQERFAMDLNYLLHREQVALFNADRAHSKAARHEHQAVAAELRTRIAARYFPGNVR